MKVCSKCKFEKEFNEFYKDKSKKDGHHSCCIICDKQYKIDNKENVENSQRQYLLNNPEKRKETVRKSDLKNKDKRKTYQKQYRLDSKDKIKEQQKQYQLDNSDKLKQYHAQYNFNNKEYKKKWRSNNKEVINKYARDKKLNNPLFKLTCNIRNLICISIKGNGYTKKSKTYEILGCSFEEFKQHLESQFTEGMTWDNHGKWHLDHIYPVSRAIDEEHLIKLNHYTNFQPLWAIDNIKKGNKIIGETENLKE